MAISKECQPPSNESTESMASHSDHASAEWNPGPWHIARLVLGFAIQVIIVFVYSMPAFLRLLWILCPPLSGPLRKQYADSRRYLQEAVTSSTTSKFKYRQLSSDHAIRLITVLPGQRSEILSCTLSEADLHEQPYYNALSYVWSTRNNLLVAGYLGPILFLSICYSLIKVLLLPDSLIKVQEAIMTRVYDWTPLRRMNVALREWCTIEKQSRLILCNGRHLYVRRNLYNFLIQTRENGDTASYWIDAISINQDDLRERSHGVIMMATIYSYADRTVAWLGPCPFLLFDHDLIRRAHLPFEQSHLEGEALVRAAIEGVQRSCARYYLVGLGYFTRTWIIQECTIPRELVFMIGPFSLKSEHMLEAACLANAAGFANDILGTLFSNPESVLAVLRGRKDYRQRGSWTLSDYVVAATGHAASDQRDMIYAGLGLVNLMNCPPTQVTIHIRNKDQQHLLHLQPDYTRATADVFVACGLNLLLEKGLTALSHACDGGGMGLSMGESLPSWVPKFGRRSSEMLDGNHRFNAGGQDKADVELLSDNSLLLRSGARVVDTIKSVHESTDFPPISGVLALLDEQPDVYAFTKETSVTAIARTVIADYIEEQTYDTSSVSDTLIQVVAEYLTQTLERMEPGIKSKKSSMEKLPSYLRVMPNVMDEIDSMMYAEKQEKYAQLQAIYSSFTSRFETRK